jgi:hypothetical protein
VAAIICTQPDPVETLGMAAYFLDENPNLLRRKEFHVQREFEKSLDFFEKDLEAFLESFPRADLEIYHDLYSVRLPKMVARILLTSTGEINFGLIPMLKERFASGNLNFHKTLAKRLDVLVNNSDVRDVIPSIKASPDLDNRGTQLLQILDGLLPDWPVCDHQAQEAALTAFLSHIRQIPPNGCFAMVVCQAELESNPKRCLEDFRELLTKGVLSRKVDKITQDFPFLFSLQSEHGETPFEELNPLMIPGVKEAALTMGVRNYREKIQRRKQVSNPLQLIKSLANGDQERFIRGKLAFEFQTRNGLLAMWHNAVAGMSEGRTCGMIKSEILKSILYAIDADYNGLSQQHLYLKKKLEEAVIAQLLQRMCLFFDPELKHHLAGNGGFVLYDRKIEGWDRIDNVDLFRAWVIEILVGAYAEIIKEDPSGSRVLDKMIVGLKECIASPKFIDRLLMSYMDQQIKEPSKNLEVFKHTPWITRTGNSTEMTLRVYQTRDKTLKSKSILARNAADLLSQLREFYEQCRQANRIIPPLLPCRIEELHAFNLIPLPRGLMHLEKSQTRFRVGKSYQKRILLRLETEANFKGHIPLEDQISINRFREHILEVWGEGAERDAPLRERLLDMILIQELTQGTRDKILSNAIPIADSNWSIDSQDLYFYCFLNPFSKAVELWKMGSDFSNPTALNPNIWIKEQPWEIFYT